MIWTNLKSIVRTSLEVQWLGLHVSTAGGTGSVSGRGTKMSHAVWCGQKLKQNKHTKTPQNIWEFPGGPVVRTQLFHCPDSVSDQGTKIHKSSGQNEKDKGKKSHMKGKPLCGSMYRNYKNRQN